MSDEYSDILSFDESVVTKAEGEQPTDVVEEKKGKKKEKKAGKGKSKKGEKGEEGEKGEAASDVNVKSKEVVATPKKGGSKPVATKGKEKIEKSLQDKSDNVGKADKLEKKKDKEGKGKEKGKGKERKITIMIPEGEENNEPKEIYQRLASATYQSQVLKETIEESDKEKKEKFKLGESRSKLMTQSSTLLKSPSKSRSKIVKHSDIINETLIRAASIRKSGDILNSKSLVSFEEYSTSTTSEEVKIEKPVIKDKKKKKDKKGGKKKKSTKSEIAETQEEEGEKESSVDDVMADIERMKSVALEKSFAMIMPPAPALPTLAELLQQAEEPKLEEPPPKKEKKEKKKKPPKGDQQPKVKMTAEMLEKMRIEAEQEAARQAMLEKMRLEAERQAGIEKEKKETFEYQLRMEYLSVSFKGIEDMNNYHENLIRQENEQAAWKFYLDCGYLPSPNVIDDMSTYLHLWEKGMTKTTVDDISQRSTDVLQLLNELTDLIDIYKNEESRKVKNWKWLQGLFREYQGRFLDMATYMLLRDVQRNMHRIDIPTADFNFEDDNIKLSVWLRVQLPIPLPNPRRPPKPRIMVKFINLNLEVTFPLSMNIDYMAVRAMYLKYDFMSDSSASFYMPMGPKELQSDLLTAVKKEWRLKLKYKYSNRDRKKKHSMELDADMMPIHVEEEKEKFASDEEIPAVPFKKLEPSASEYALSFEDEIYAESRRIFFLTLPDDELNLRKYIILGGVYQFHLLYQPPQPQDFVIMDMTTTRLSLPKQLDYVSLTLQYTPPKPHKPGVIRKPEEIEREMKMHEEEMEKLMLITLKWPQHVIFLELPMVYHWDDEKQLWTKRDIHDLKHVEDLGELSFRTGVFGTFGLATLRYGNLPYQAWELRPEADGSVSFNITSAILILEFNVKEGLVCISQVHNSPNRALQHLIGVYFKLGKLKRLMKEAGVDIFPEPDSFCYIESGTCEKHWPLESHHYYCMARMSNTFNFAWSRWNISVGRRKIVMQMREYILTKSAKQRNYSMLLATPLKASLIECTEVSQEFCEDDIENLKFTADLNSLVKAVYSITVRKKLDRASEEMIYVLTQLLRATRVLSFS